MEPPQLALSGLVLTLPLMISFETISRDAMLPDAASTCEGKSILGGAALQRCDKASLSTGLQPLRFLLTPH
jgi:hypothetical protein